MKKHRLFSHQRTKDKQLLLIMKFFSLFLLIGIGNCLATNTYSQNKLFTIKSSQKTITEVFHEIEKIVNILFSTWTNSLIRTAK